MNSAEFPHAHVDGLLASLLYFSRALIIYFADAQTCGKHLLISIFTHGSPFGDIVKDIKSRPALHILNKKGCHTLGIDILQKHYTRFLL